jgi:hypothetical protein
MLKIQREGTVQRLTYVPFSLLSFPSSSLCLTRLWVSSEVHQLTGLVNDSGVRADMRGESDYRSRKFLSGQSPNSLPLRVPPQLREFAKEDV